jgi:hypothetical protein
MMFQKKRLVKNKKIRVRFSIVDLPAKPAKQKKQVSLKKLLRLHSRRSGRGDGTGVLIFGFFFFFKIPDLAHRPTSAPIVAENRR